MPFDLDDFLLAISATAIMRSSGMSRGLDGQCRAWPAERAFLVAATRLLAR